ncbi:MAG: hypothetical protein ACOH2N_07385 [Devosia sp.]
MSGNLLGDHQARIARPKVLVLTLAKLGGGAVEVINDKDVEHVVILVPGIRDFAGWKKGIEEQLIEVLPDLKVYGTNIGFFNIFQFLFPFLGQRKWAYDRVFNVVRQVRMVHPKAKISYIGHSFGTFCLAEILNSEFDFEAHRIIFCGSVVPKEFPFAKSHKNFTRPILNDVGTADQWPVMAQSFSIGCGSIGTYGYGDSPMVTDRFHNDMTHGSFFTGKFAKKYWAPFLKDGTIVKGSVPKAAPPAWIELLARTPIKLILGILLGLLALWLIALFLFPRKEIYGDATVPMAASPSIPTYSWEAMVDLYVTSARELCPMQSSCPPGWLQVLIWGREFRGLSHDTSLKAIASCQPYKPERATTDPYAAIRALQVAFPTCTTFTETPAQVSWDPNLTNLVPSSDGSILYCDCTAAQIKSLVEPTDANFR